MARPDKTAAVAELADAFRASGGAVLTDYRGLTVKQLQELRRVLGDNASYSVVKNTLTKIAADEAGVEGFDELLVGPTAIAFIRGDAVEVAKALRDFARANSPLVIKGGILDGLPLTIDEIARIADLESREVLLGRLAGALLASLQNAVSLFSAPLAQVARLAGALQAKAELDPSTLRGGPTEPSPAEQTVPAEMATDDTARELTEAAPEVTNAVPEATDTSPAVTDAVPEATDSSPESTGTGTPAEATDSAPEVNNSTPEATGSAPEVNNSTPEATGSAPEVNNSTPETTGSAPEVNNSTPEATGSAPEVSDSAPETTGTASEPTDESSGSSDSTTRSG